MIAVGRVWPVCATLAAQGASGGDVTPPPPPPGEPPVAGDGAAEQQPAEELIPPPAPVDWQEMIKDDLVTDIIEGRRRPGYRPDLPDALTQDNVGALRPPPPQAFPGMEDQLPIPDRWRLIETLGVRSEEHTSELQSLMRISYAVFCLKTKTTIH